MARRHGRRRLLAADVGGVGGLAVLEGVRKALFEVSGLAGWFSLQEARVSVRSAAVATMEHLMVCISANVDFAYRGVLGTARFRAG